MRPGTVKALIQTPPATKLVVVCIECGAVAKTLLGAHAEIQPGVLFLEHGWVLSLLTPPGTEPVEMGPVCKTCATKIYPDEVRAEAAKHFERGRS